MDGTKETGLSWVEAGPERAQDDRPDLDTPGLSKIDGGMAPEGTDTPRDAAASVVDARVGGEVSCIDATAKDIAADNSSYAAEDTGTKTGGSSGTSGLSSAHGGSGGLSTNAGGSGGTGGLSIPSNTGGTLDPDAGTRLDALSSPDEASHDPLLQIGPVTTGTDTVRPTLPTASRAGTLLVLSAVFNRGASPTLPSDWKKVADSYTVGVATGIWYQAKNPGGVTSASAWLSGATFSVAQLSEWDSVSSWDAASYCNSSLPDNAMTCSTASSVYSKTSHPQELALGCFGETLNSAASVTTTDNKGFVVLGENDSSVTRLHYHFGYRQPVAINSQIVGTVSSTATGIWAAVVCSFW